MMCLPQRFRVNVQISVNASFTAANPHNGLIFNHYFKGSIVIVLCKCRGKVGSGSSTGFTAGVGLRKGSERLLLRPWMSIEFSDLFLQKKKSLPGIKMKLSKSFHKNTSNAALTWTENWKSRNKKNMSCQTT